MNKLFIVGNLTRDPELRSTPNGIPVCTFTVAVNRRRAAGAEAAQQPEADFFRVTAWRQLGENCNRYLAKGRKVAVVGAVQVSTYTAQDGTTRASLEGDKRIAVIVFAGHQRANFKPFDVHIQRHNFLRHLFRRGLIFFGFSQRQ